jgi:hypothetical protein
VSEREIDNYLAALDDPERSTSVELRRAILDVVPDAERGIRHFTRRS